MSNLLFWRNAHRRNLALAGVVFGAALAAGCSTDVQRFGYTGSIRPTGSLQTAPVEPVQSASLNSPAPAYEPRDTYRRSPVAASAGYVSVQPGDTAYSVAQRNGITVSELAAANGLRYPYDIRIGQRLMIPAGGAVAATSQEPAKVAARGSSTYKVVPGDTLYSISRRYGVGVGALANANNLDDYASIKVGQTLSIPSGSDAMAIAQGGPLQPAAGSGGDRRVLSARTVDSEAKPTEEKLALAAPRERTEPLPAPPERAAAEFRWPVRGRIVSHFGVASDGTRNDGINIAVPEGASIKAADNGVVAYAGDELKGYGNLILIRHANDWVTAYAHNSTLLVNRGDTVKRGQIIAKAGQTGTVDMPQLHFEVRRGAKAVNPMDYLDGA